MFLDVRDMELRPLRFSRDYAVGEFDFLDSLVRQASPLAVEGQAELREALEEIRIKGQLKVDLELTCDRCLEPYPFPIDNAFDLVYLPDSEEMREVEKNLTADDAVLAFYDGTGLELEDVLREQVLLALPMRKLCREECEGLCPTCGENWNDRACSCAPPPIDPRLEGFKQWAQKNP